MKKYSRMKKKIRKKWFKVILKYDFIKIFEAKEC